MSLWHHFEVTLGHFGVTLGSFWSDFEVTFGLWRWCWFSLASLCNHCGVTLGIQRSAFEKHSFPPHILMVIQRSVFKKHSFPLTYFNDFIKRRRLTCRIEKQISLMIMSIRMRFGSILDAFGRRFGSVLPLSGRFECKFASDRPQIAPKSAHKQIKNILPKDFRMS